MALTFSDFRGNKFTYGQKIDDQICDEPECNDSAVLLPCNAERDYGRCHWHGGIHRLDDGKGTWFCEKHGLEHLTANQKVIGRDKE